MEVVERRDVEPMELKVEQLLAQVQVEDYAAINKQLQQVLEDIKTTLDNIPTHQVYEDGISKFIADLGAPVDKVGFTFIKPEAFVVGGSYSFEAIARPCNSIDILVKMPKGCFHEKDFWDHVYHAKRCMYLYVVAAHLNSCQNIQKIEWSAFESEVRKPILIIRLDPVLGAISEYCLRIIPFATSIFAVSKLNLTRKNIRSGSEGLLSTPNYNSSILEDMFLKENTEFIQNIFQDWNELRHALMLLKVWARNRDSIYTHDGLNGYLLAVILVYLTTQSGGSRIKRTMKPFSIFCIVLDFLAKPKLCSKAMILHPSPKQNILPEEQRQYAQTFGFVLCDSSGHFNLAFRLSRNALYELQDEANLALNSMQTNGDAAFEGLFITKVGFAAKFDFCVRVHMKGLNEVDNPKVSMDKEHWRDYEEKIHCLLIQGLHARAKFVRVIWNTCPSSDWHIEQGFETLGSEPLLIGILISSFDKGFQVRDIGPKADNKEEVSKFRKFWGVKAETYRFPDGTIAECTMWKCNDWEKHLIIQRIAEHVLSRHLSLSTDKIVVVTDQLDFALSNGRIDPYSFTGDIFKAFDILSRRLRGLDDLPLRISSVQPLDSAFHHASVFPPEPHPLAIGKTDSFQTRIPISTCIQSMDVMIELEGSRNWPVDTLAVEKIKSTFLLTIGESLQKQWDVRCVATESDVNVLMNGFAFRLQMRHERDGSLLKKQVGIKPIQTVDVDKDLLLQSHHSAMINGLHGRYTIYGPTVRLAKRWVASHLFSDFLRAEAVELLVAYIFVKPFPFQVPYSRMTGFLRFLQLLSEYDWSHAPLIVDVNNDLTSKDEMEITETYIKSQRLDEAKSNGKPPAIFLATGYDKESEAWTKLSPSVSVLRKIMTFARSSANYLVDLIVKGETGQRRWESVFRTPLKNYDALILLHGDKLPYPQRLLFPSEVTDANPLAVGSASKEFAPYVKIKDLKQKFHQEEKLLVDFDPARCFIKDIKNELPDTFKIWYDSFGSDIIALTWEKPFKRRKIERKDGVACGPADVVRFVGEIGKGLVKSIYLLKSPASTNS